jgi:hypothetical protein
MMSKLLNRMIFNRAWLLGLLACLGFMMPILAQTLPPVPFATGDVRLETKNSRENLQELSIQHSQLSLLPPVPGGNLETPDFTRELYQMQWRDDDPIDVYVIRPKGVRHPPVAIYLYGFPVDDGRFRNDTFCKLVTQGRVAAIGFVPALTGQRYHGVPMKTWFVSELHDSIVKTVHDVQMVVTYAASREDLDVSRVGIFGQGSGATIAGLAASVDPRITAVDLMDPWGDWSEWFANSKLVPQAERADFLKPEFLEALVPLDPLQWLPKIKDKAVKVDDVMYETGTPPEAKARIESALPGSALLVRYKSPEEFQENALKDGKLVDWINQQLTDRPTMANTKEATSDVQSKKSENAIQTRDSH